MKRAVIKVHGNPTLVRIVTELALKAGFKKRLRLPSEDAQVIMPGCSLSGPRIMAWSENSIDVVLNRDEVHDSIDGKLILNRASIHGAPILDAATQMDKVIAFFEQPAVEPVKLATPAGVLTIKPSGDIVAPCGAVLSSATVDALIKARAELLKEVA